MAWLLIPVCSQSSAARSLEKISANIAYLDKTNMGASLAFKKAICALEKR